MYLALSYDHRIIDGREAVSFLVRVEGPCRTPSGCCWIDLNWRLAPTSGCASAGLRPGKRSVALMHGRGIPAPLV